MKHEHSYAFAYIPAELRWIALCECGDRLNVAGQPVLPDQHYCRHWHYTYPYWQYSYPYWMPTWPTTNTTYTITGGSTTT